MNKSQLAELYQKRNWPVDEFISSAEFKSLETEPEQVEALERFRLPEVSRLICCSNSLMALPWAAPYKNIRPLYQNPASMDIRTVIENFPAPEEFKACILDYADSRILGDINQHFEEVKRNKKSCVRRKTDLNKQIDKLKSAGDSSEESERKLEQLQTEQKDLDRYLKDTKKHQEYLQQAIKNNVEEMVEKRREEAYASIFFAVPAEEVFLKQFIQTGTLTEAMCAQLREISFFMKLLESLDKIRNRDFAIPVIMKLFELGAIDLESEEIQKFIIKHEMEVSDHLLKCWNDILADECDERALLDVVLRIVSDNANKADGVLFHELWDNIRDANAWISLLKYAEDADIIDGNALLTALLNGMGTEAGEALAEALFSSKAQEVHINPTAAISEALNRQVNIPTVILTTAFQKMEQISRSAQRKIRAADRKLNGQAQNLFKAVYLPVERLETFAIDMRMSKGNIPCQLVANQLVDIAADLRTGMLQLALAPACDIDDWRRGYPVPFDPEKHRKPMNVEDAPEKVILQTMGFQYTGDDGQLQQYHAQVVPKVKNASAASDEPESESKLDSLNKKQPRQYRHKHGANPKQKTIVKTHPKKQHRKGQKGGVKP